MKKIILVIIVVICSINILDSRTIEKSANAVAINHNDSNDEWETWTRVRACAYYKSSGKRVTEYDYGYDWHNCTVERRVGNGYVQYRISVNYTWIPVQKSDKSEYKYCARPKDSIYIYYFNF